MSPVVPLIRPVGELDFDPISDFVLLELVKEKTKGNIALPEGAQMDDCPRAKVLRVGPGRQTDFGIRLDMPIKPGDTVFLIGNGGSPPMEVTINNRKCILCRAGSLAGKVPDTKPVVAAEQAEPGHYESNVKLAA